jgi:sigma-B regulation protein RsbQ
VAADRARAGQGLPGGAVRPCGVRPVRSDIDELLDSLDSNYLGWSAVTVPTLIPQCARDAIAPAEVGAFVRDEIPGSILVTLPATGHCPQLSAPEETFAAIASFAAPGP